MPWADVRSPIAGALDASRTLTLAAMKKKEAGPSGPATFSDLPLIHVESSIKNPLVDLTGQLSKPSAELVRMLRGERSNVTRVASQKGEERRARKKYLRLSDQDRAQVVRRHAAGSSQHKPAPSYGVHRTTNASIVASLLRDARQLRRDFYCAGKRSKRINA